ncbi:MAG: tRNA (adenosine(37)-N6)-threonylcarbamoyltransferase complex ATPase subunit type 1 TsaE [Campylobacteraceae bacterium 4484_166]|nr:MAG: tRNA (adenosine(37)-N6)-threonylcarbamoyltransferase complex ATPase subunit type 1 TsaE [Campylobacteraceae bacterium 4484_166]
MEATIDDIAKVVKYIDSLINNKDMVVLLKGDIASGKTTLVQEYLKIKNSKAVAVSPTFCLQNIYDGCIYHYDIYNKNLEQFISMGLFDEFENSGVHFVEWADDKLIKLTKEYGFDVINIEITKKENKRIYKICID